jgi:hypothetical protein
MLDQADSARVIGIVMLLLGLTLVSPVPFGHVAPALAIMLLALAWLEEDGVALLVALIAALASIAATVAEVWGPSKRSTGSTRRLIDRILRASLLAMSRRIRIPAGK